MQMAAIYLVTEHERFFKLVPLASIVSKFIKYECIVHNVNCIL